MRWDAPRRHYGGRVIDGPWRGKQISKPYPDFQVAVIPPMSVCEFNPQADLVGDTIATRFATVTYRWSFSLGEWCMVY